MIDLLKKQFKPDMPQEEKLNLTREFLQLAALKIIYDKGFFNNIAFVGGTCLRFLHNLRRFSEDLDFSLVNKDNYSFSALAKELKNGFRLYGLQVETKPKEDKTVQSAFIKFPGLLKELKLSDLDEQKLSIKIEVDANPPLGWVLVNTVINKVYLLNITHFDLASLFATKLHACFFRKFVKGRDFYDLVWYLGRKTQPNYTLLNNAIEQTEHKYPGINKDNFKKFIAEELDKIDFTQVKKDVEQLVEDREELKLLNPITIKTFL